MRLYERFINHLREKIMDKESVIDTIILTIVMLPLIMGVMGGRHSWFWKLVAWAAGVEVAP